MGLEGQQTLVPKFATLPRAAAFRAPGQPGTQGTTA